MLTCPYCQHQNSSSATQCQSCGMNLGNDTLPSGTLLFADTLEVGQVLGRGGFGIVYEAFHFEHQKRLAIKELFPQGLASRGQRNQVQVSSQTEMQAAIARTSREAAMLRLLKHPSATKLFAYWEENGTAYMALELLQGQTLESRIERGQLLNAEEAKQALLTILEVLEELHSHGFLHRDIKPANIMFTPTRVELIDFGSLTEFKKGERTKVTSRIATPEYAPLEQFGSEVTLSPATDLYALAATFCEAMTGSRVPSALERANGASIEPNVLAMQRVSRELANVLEKALELRMEFRFSSVAAVISSFHQNDRPSEQAIFSPIGKANFTKRRPYQMSERFVFASIYVFLCYQFIFFVFTRNFAVEPNLIFTLVKNPIFSISTVLFVVFSAFYFAPTDLEFGNYQTAIKIFDHCFGMFKVFLVSLILFLFLYSRLNF